jgi:rhodanese-related sulfurtransferase
MKKVLALIALFGVLFVAGCSSNAGAVQTVDPQTWLQTASQAGATVVDVRTSGEYAAGHIDGAVNIDVEGPTFASDIEKLDKNGTYALYCHSGRRSALAADQMSQAGFTKVTNLKGGIADLQAAGGVVVGS